MVLALALQKFALRYGHRRGRARDWLPPPHPHTAPWTPSRVLQHGPRAVGQGRNNVGAHAGRSEFVACSVVARENYSEEPSGFAFSYIFAPFRSTVSGGSRPQADVLVIWKLTQDVGQQSRAAITPQPTS